MKWVRPTIDLLRPRKARCESVTLDNSEEFAGQEFTAKYLGAKLNLLETGPLRLDARALRT